MPKSPLFHQRFYAELKRRRVFRVMALYGATSFAVLEAADILIPMMGMSDAVTRAVASLLLLGFPIAIILDWPFELTPEGVQRTAEATPGERSEIITAPASKRWPSGLLALEGEADLAFQWLNKARVYGDPGLAEVVAENGFEGIHSDPRWLPFLENLGRSDEQLALIEFEVTVPG